MAKFEGPFSTGLFSLQLQVQHLLEGAGGEHAVRFLDALSNLSGAEQEKVLAAFTRCINRFAESPNRASSSQDKEFKEIENELYNDIESAMKIAANSEAVPLNRRLSVVPGGKSKRSAQSVQFRPTIGNGDLIDLNKVRESRRVAKENPLLN